VAVPDVNGAGDTGTTFDAGTVVGVESAGDGHELSDVEP
jgi:hypothetical protein